MPPHLFSTPTTCRRALLRSQKSSAAAPRPPQQFVLAIMIPVKPTRPHQSPVLAVDFCCVAYTRIAVTAQIRLLHMLNRLSQRHASNARPDARQRMHGTAGKRCRLGRHDARVVHVVTGRTRPRRRDVSDCLPRPIDVRDGTGPAAASSNRAVSTTTALTKRVRAAVALPMRTVSCCCIRRCATKNGKQNGGAENGRSRNGTTSIVLH